MPTHRMLCCLAALVLPVSMLTACTGVQAAPERDALAHVYTAVALTVSSSSLTPTSAPAATATITAFPTPTLLPAATATTGATYSYSSGCNNGAYVSDVTVADGEEMAPGESFTKTWEFLNTGSCAWTSSFSVVFVSGQDMGATTADLDGTVAVGANGDVSVDLTAPEDEGTYTGYWRLADASGLLFGEQVYVQIIVSEDASTLTPTPTEETETSTPTPTATPTTTSAVETPTPSPTDAVIPSSTTESLTNSPTQVNSYDRYIRG